MDATTQEIIDLSKKNKPEKIVTPKAFDREHQAKVKTIWKYVGKIALLVLIVLSFARVPFIGSFFDSLFDYVFGIGKYLFYGLGIFVMIGVIFDTGYTRVIKNRRFVIFSIVALLSACCIISGVTGLMYANNAVHFVEGMKTYHTSWAEYFKTWQYSGYFHSSYQSGGIIAELIAYLFSYASLVVVIVVFAIVLVISIFIIMNVNYRSTRIGLKIRGWMIKKLGGTFKYDGYNELKAKRDNQNKFKKTKRVDIESIALTSNSLPYSVLPDSDLNKFAPNFKHARHLQNKLATMFRNADIDCLPTDINVYSSYSEICFEAKNKTAVQAIVNLQPKIAKVTRLNHFNLSIRGTIVNIEIENAYFSKFSLKTAFNLYDDGKDMNAVFGLDKENKLCTQNFRNNSSALIIGQKGSGSATLAVVMALSMCYITSPDDLELIVLNPNCEATYSYFNNLPHTNNKVFESVNNCTEKLHDIQRTMNERLSLFKVNNVGNIDQYNRSVTNTQPKFKHILVLMTNFDSIVKDTFQNNKILSDLLVNGQKAGIYIVMQSYIANNDVIDKAIFDNVSDKYILTLSSPEESIKIFNNKRGYQLHNNGDCLHFSANRLNSMKRMQICNINFNELTTDIDIIKTFHIARIKHKQEEILAGDKHETNN